MVTVRRQSRSERLRQIEQRIGRRRLIWFGTRGSDAVPLLHYPQFTDCASLIAPLQAVSVSHEACLETILQQRVDLERYNTDADRSEQALALHRFLGQACDSPAVLVAYRPAAFLTSVHYPRADHVQYLGLFHAKQALFEHKPYVETEFGGWARHVYGDEAASCLPWRYYADEDIGLVEEVLEQAPIVLRSNYTSGGIGLTLVHDMFELRQRLPSHVDGFLAASPFLDPNIPLNVNACVFPDGSVSFHAPSLQLIGITSCSNRRFGYCGNDFGRVRDLEPEVLDALENVTLQCGRWLHSSGYTGAFGVDAMLHHNQVYLTEINPRFQGSSAVAATLAAEMDLPDLYCDHMAAFMGLAPVEGRSVSELATQQPPWAQIICHNRTDRSLRRSEANPPPDPGYTVALLPALGVEVHPEAVLFKILAPESVTLDGHTILPKYDSILQQLVGILFV